jgi:hypothetical protein
VLIVRWIPLVGFIAPMGLSLMALTAMGRDLDGAMRPLHSSRGLIN